MERVYYPWYESYWLSAYTSAKRYLGKHHPEKLAQFEQVLAPLQTDPAFKASLQTDIIRKEEFESLVASLRQIDRLDLPTDEFIMHGRRVIRDDELFDEILRQVTDRVAALVNEPLEPSYSFLALYNNFGVLPPHLDALDAKWTLGICLDQSAPWPIHISQVVSWPEDLAGAGPEVQEQILQDPAIDFGEFLLEPGQAVLMAASSQWHYRSQIPNVTTDNFCDILYLSYIPKGMGEFMPIATWSDWLGVPELAELVKR